MRFVGFFSVIFLSLTSLTHVWASVGVSSYRLYLDSDNSTESFIISNRLTQPQTCNVDLTHFSFDPQGNMTNYAGSELPQYAADKLIRYSPRNFDLPANQKQTVRFTLRRKNDTAKMEHRAFVRVSCKPPKTPVKSTESSKDFVAVKLSPVLKHNIPLQVRPSKLRATAEFHNVRMAGTTLNFDMHRSGNRSIIGKIAIFDKTTGKLITESGALVMYIETFIKSFTLRLDKVYDLQDLEIKFVEDSRYGGDIIKIWP
jgi:P pilus assembly chaperone PapD